MVRGLQLFSAWFEKYTDQYVLIGGTAASLAMNAAGVEFRQTKDLDIVIHIEVLKSEFITKFWEFINAGQYEIKLSGAHEKPCLYRFQKPADDEFPYMIELFARAPIGLEIAFGHKLTPLRTEDLVSSLSAILLDDDYYKFILENRVITEGLPVIAAVGLIPLKALAWLNLKESKEAGEQIDSRDIKKHLIDIENISRLLAPNFTIDISAKIISDLSRFIVELKKLEDSEKNYSTLTNRLRATYGL